MTLEKLRKIVSVARFSLINSLQKLQCYEYDLVYLFYDETQSSV
jgi:hypothetical protein